MSGMKSWSVTPANNVLANTGFTMDEGQAPSTLNDSIRQAMADIRTEWAQGANIASAATVDLSAATGGYVHITGVVTITSFGTVSAGIRRKITFDGALTLTHNVTSLILPTGASIVTVAGDTCEAMSEGSGNWRVLWYAGKNVQAMIATATTSVLTPLVQSNTGGILTLETTTNQSILIKTNGANRTWTDSGGHYPDADNTFPSGKATNRWSVVLTPIIDTGTTGSGALKTNNGTTVLTWANTGAVGWGTGVANFGTITKRKTADESVTSSTTLQDDDHLTFAIAANEEWNIDLQLRLNSAINLSNMGMKAAITVPAGATLDALGQITTIDHSATTSGTAMDFITTSFNNTDVCMRIKVWVLNGATLGSVTLKWCQSTSNGTALKLLKGSALYATRVA